MAAAKILADRHRLRPLELLWGMPIGPDEECPLLVAEPARSIRGALEATILGALARPPCLVSFSGGRDSSLVLGLAAQIAARHGLPAPVPITNRFPELPETDEASWQEHVVAHLGLEDWIRLEWTDELDVVGPYAQQMLRRHGLIAPFNSHFHLPMIEAAKGGSLLTGIGGDELLSPVSRDTAASVLLTPRAPRMRELAPTALAVCPRPFRVGVIAHRRRIFRTFRWLLPGARRRLALAYADWESRDPIRWDTALRSWWWRSRVLQCNRAGKRVLGAAADVKMVHPLCEPEVLATAASVYGRRGPASRAAALAEIGGDVLPAAVHARGEKASFDRVFWSRHARETARGWEGDGADPDLVDPRGLRREWASDVPTPFSYTLLQAAWLASASSAAPVEVIDET